MPISLLKNIYWPTKLIVLKTVKTAIKNTKSGFQKKQILLQHHQRKKSTAVLAVLLTTFLLSN